MAINKDQFRELVRTTLKELEPEIPYSKEAEELIMLTAAAESNLGEYLEQVKGPAQGVCQMEPATHDDLWDNYLRYKPELQKKILGFGTTGMSEYDLKYNLMYSIAMCRVLYRRSSTPLPDMNPVNIAGVWKKVYNTSAGKGTVAKAVDKYNTYVVS